MFIIFSIIGWISECIFCSVGERKFVHNRGFLIGPCCPIYGFGALYCYLFLSKYANDPIVLFVMALFGTSILEYVTSYLMEKLFKARWWDYTNEKFNINGRVCLKNSILFGIGGALFIYYIKPAFINLVNRIPNNVFITAGIILFIIFMTDLIVSFTIMSKLKIELTDIKKDSTEEIENEVKEILLNHAFYAKKLFRSFPNFSLSLPTSDDIKKAIQKTLENIDKLRMEQKEKIRNLKKKLK